MDTTINDYLFREITEEDLPKVLEIYNYYVLNSTATFQISTLTIDEMREMVINTHSKYKAFVIVEEDNICGYCLLAQFNTKEAYDETAEITVYLKHDAIGKGLGTIAIQNVEDYAREQNIYVLVAIICGENSRSIKLFAKNNYFKCGHFREVGMKFGRRLDVVNFQKILK